MSDGVGSLRDWDVVPPNNDHRDKELARLAKVVQHLASNVEMINNKLDYLIAQLNFKPYIPSAGEKSDLSDSATFRKTVVNEHAANGEGEDKLDTQLVLKKSVPVPIQSTKQSPQQNFDSCSTHRLDGSHSTYEGLLGCNATLNSFPDPFISEGSTTVVESVNGDVLPEDCSAGPYLKDSETGKEKTEVSEHFVSDTTNELLSQLSEAHAQTQLVHDDPSDSSLSETEENEDRCAETTKEKPHTTIEEDIRLENKSCNSESLQEIRTADTAVSDNSEKEKQMAEEENDSNNNDPDLRKKPKRKEGPNFEIKMSRKKAMILDRLDQVRVYTHAELRKVIRKTRTWSSQDNRPEILKKTYRIIDGDEDNPEPSQNNQAALPPSGLKNEHGDIDNRYEAEAHNDGSPYSGVKLSNSDLIKHRQRKTGPESQAVRPKDNGFVSVDVLKSIIQNASEEALACKDLKSAGVDTVICLDVSASMAGKPLEVAKETVNRLLDGFEYNAVEYYLEENVALVTFGKDTRIVHHLTNDFERIREALANVEADGPSPLWLGLALSFTELKQRGGVCSVGRLSVNPRIILITDGCLSNKSNLRGKEAREFNESAFQEIWELLQSPAKESVSCIDCLAVGQSLKNVLQFVSDRRVFDITDIEYLTQFFRIRDSANGLLDRIVKKELNPDQLTSVVEQLGLHERAKEELFAILAEVLPRLNLDEEQTVVQQTATAMSAQGSSESGSASNSSSNPTSLEVHPGSQDGDHLATVLELETSEDTDEIDDVIEPMFGAAVLPHKDKEGYVARENFFGVVVGPRKKGLVKTLWSDGTIEKCRYGINGKYDIVLADEADTDRSTMKIGALVERGPDWKWKEQDGGPGNIGVVMQMEKKNVVIVVWAHGGQGNYRYAYHNKYDVKIVNRGHHARPHTEHELSAESLERHTERSIEEGKTESFDEGDDVKQAYWQVFDPNSVWRTFPSDINETVEDMFQKSPEKVFLVKIQGRSCKVNLQDKKLCDLVSQKHYTMRRLEATLKELRELEAEKTTEESQGNLS